jgi:hypothetical protein|tara:strand:+ start:304 stop:582 length:279 start_codon:yes stop_codon:yes gene_type:complete
MDNPKNMKVEKDSELKEWLVDYVGNKENPDDDGVTVEMIVSTVAKEFPEFLMLVAEENFLRGYEQALDDVKMLNKENDQDTQIHQGNARSNN